MTVQGELQLQYFRGLDVTTNAMVPYSEHGFSITHLKVILALTWVIEYLRACDTSRKSERVASSEDEAGTSAFSSLLLAWLGSGSCGSPSKELRHQPWPQSQRR